MIASKLLFDFICCWSFRFHNNGKSNIELDSLKNRYINFLLENFDQNEIKNIKMLTLIDFLMKIEKYKYKYKYKYIKSKKNYHHYYIAHPIVRQIVLNKNYLK